MKVPCALALSGNWIPFLREAEVGGLLELLFFLGGNWGASGIDVAEEFLCEICA